MGWLGGTVGSDIRECASGGEEHANQRSNQRAASAEQGASQL